MSLGFLGESDIYALCGRFQKIITFSVRHPSDQIDIQLVFNRSIVGALAGSRSLWIGLSIGRSSMRVLGSTITGAGLSVPRKIAVPVSLSVCVKTLHQTQVARNVLSLWKWQRVRSGGVEACLLGIKYRIGVARALKLAIISLSFTSSKLK